MTKHNKEIKGLALKNYIARKGLFIRIPIPAKLKELEPEIALGRAVLDKALLDCLEDKEVLLWFDLKNEDFNTICFIAFLEPIKVLENFEIVMRKIGKK